MRVLLVVALVLAALNMAMRFAFDVMDPWWFALEATMILFCSVALIFTRNER